MPFDETTYQRITNGVFRHMGSARFDPAKVRFAGSERYARNKPDGGLWASPDGEGRDTWELFRFWEYIVSSKALKVYDANREQYNSPFDCPIVKREFEAWHNSPHFLFRLKTGARVLCVREPTVLANSVLRFKTDEEVEQFMCDYVLEDLERGLGLHVDREEFDVGALQALLFDNLPRTTCFTTQGVENEYLRDAWRELAYHIDFEWIARSYDALLYLEGESPVTDAMFWAWDCDSLVVFNPDVVQQIDG